MVRRKRLIFRDWPLFLDVVISKLKINRSMLTVIKTHWLISIISVVTVLHCCVLYQYSFHRIKAKVIKRKHSQDENEVFYYSSIRWKKKKKIGYVFDNDHGRWKFLSLRQRAQVTSTLKKHEMPEINL